MVVNSRNDSLLTIYFLNIWHDKNVKTLDAFAIDCVLEEYNFPSVIDCGDNHPSKYTLVEDTFAFVIDIGDNHLKYVLEEDISSCRHDNIVKIN